MTTSPIWRLTEDVGASENSNSDCNMKLLRYVTLSCFFLFFFFLSQEVAEDDDLDDDDDDD